MSSLIEVSGIPRTNINVQALYIAFLGTISYYVHIYYAPGCTSQPRPSQRPQSREKQLGA